MAYEAPTPADLRAYYPAFGSVSDGTLQVYLDRAGSTDVDQTWREADYQPAIIAAAAHRAVRAGALGTDTVAGMAAAGLTDFKSGSFEVRFAPDAAKASVAGGWESTAYGQDYLALLRANKGGMRLAGGGNGVPAFGCIQTGIMPPYAG